MSPLRTHQSVRVDIPEIKVPAPIVSVRPDRLANILRALAVLLLLLLFLHGHGWAQGLKSAAVLDPCQSNAKIFGSFSGTASARIITGTSAKKVYFCSWNDQEGAAQNIAVVEGTGSTCATSIAAFPGLSGGTTAATGWNTAANGGRTYGDGAAAIAGEATNADDVCVLLANAVQTNIGFSYVLQ